MTRRKVKAPKHVPVNPLGRPRIAADTENFSTSMPPDVHQAMKLRAVVEGVALGELYTRAVAQLDAASPRPRFLFAMPQGSRNVMISCSGAFLVRARELAGELRGSLGTLFLTAAVGYLDRIDQEAA